MIRISSKNGQLVVNDKPRSFMNPEDSTGITGSVTLDNTVITAGMATTLHTGNGVTQSVVTGVDMATQWGNSATETFGGLVWIKTRNVINDHVLTDTVRGATKTVYTDLTNAEGTAPGGLTAFNVDGFAVGSGSGFNTNTDTHASWVFQTTHRSSGTTNHGKAYTCHYNPFTGFTIVKYEGSGLAGHEIPHHLGRKLGFIITKNLSAVTNWLAIYKETSYLQLNTTVAEGGYVCTLSETFVSTYENTSTNQYIMYGWANSYFDEANALIGNYEVGIYQGTEAAGNKVQTRGKPAWVMIKRLDSTGSWYVGDNLRSAFDGYIYANNSGIENQSGVADILDVASDGFLVKSISSNWNASGGQYLYMVAYDNDSGSGKSKYPRATDTSNININALVPLAQGTDSIGNISSVISKNETISGLTLTQGKNYPYLKKDGTYGVSKFPPQRSNYSGFGEFFDVNTNTWYNSPSVFSDTMDSAANWTALNSTVSVVTGYLKVQSAVLGAMAHKLLTVTPGKIYKVVFDVFSPSSNTQANVGCVYLRENINGSFVAFSVNPPEDVWTRREITFTAGTAPLYLRLDPARGDNETVGDFAFFNNISVFPINNSGEVDLTDATPISESRNYLDCIIHADAGGQAIRVEKLPKVYEAPAILVKDIKAKNVYSAWVSFDGTTTPCTIKDSYNVKAVIRTATGKFDIYFEDEMKDTKYICNYTSAMDSQVISKSTNKITVGSMISSTAAYTNYAINDLHILGGK